MWNDSLISRLHEDAPKSTNRYGTLPIERKYLTLRTRIKRLARKTICVSKSILMHDAVIGLFINRFGFGLSV
jgi:insertion element IS1 protein InsB